MASFVLGVCGIARTTLHVSKSLRPRGKLTIIAAVASHQPPRDPGAFAGLRGARGRCADTSSAPKMARVDDGKR